MMMAESGLPAHLCLLSTVNNVFQFLYSNFKFRLMEMFSFLDTKESVKPRATSLLASLSSGSEAATPTSPSLDPNGDLAGTPTGPWSAFSSSGNKRQSKQARQVARQTELKR